MVDVERIGMLARDLGREMLGTVIRDFEHEADDILARLAARPAPPADAIKADLHMLRGGAMTLGCDVLAERCAAQEEQLERGEAPFDPAPLIAAFKDCSTRLAAWSADRG
ncbi:Hpt domain-containing protein [Profundibacterium mesophilum]|uniref:HPT Histidine Phosphotransfer domain protein n=1 Tax=Profundibacterium mesophilum KAUST100406-0324 TaxID=1037889 RepID=A0A921NVE4_9RHOB|nr:Hpt domain-containing protein [Profundibacterium mesophilum]KAF0676338.1 putative HPT Histidine Phosphotransfer domain protein [Profundibacterium mesophilum KAUST100406-0324]